MIKWVEAGKASVLVGGQFGSEGKGQAAAWLARLPGETFDMATTNAGAQAGHTTAFRKAIPNVPSRFVCFHLPTTAVVQRSCMAMINAGSIIDVDQLFAEMRDCNMHMINVFIHPRAAVIKPENRMAERALDSSTTRIASTQKGVGAAIADKIMRRTTLAKDDERLRLTIAREDGDTINDLLAAGSAVAVEVPQGLDLSLNHGLEYPYTTSRDCWVGSGISDAGVHPSFVGPIAMIVRTHPIRVGNMYNEFNEQIGTSGPFYPDSMELDWAKSFPDIEPERTTVTKRVRRIATWSNKQYEHGLRLNRPTIVVLTFCDYLRSVHDFQALLGRMAQIEFACGISVQKVFSFGPFVEDMTDDVDEAQAWYEKRSF